MLFDKWLASATRLHRWCLPTSPAYKAVCNPMRKGFLADHDNGASVHPPEPKKPEASEGRTVVTALLAQWHG